MGIRRILSIASRDRLEGRRVSEGSVVEWKRNFEVVRDDMASTRREGSSIWSESR